MKNNKINKAIIIVAILLLVVISTIVIFWITSRNKSQEPTYNYTQYDVLKEAINKYNEKQENTENQVSLVENETDIIVMIGNIGGIKDGEIHTSMMNYTTRNITSTIHDRTRRPIFVVNITVDEHFNINEVMEYVCSTGEINDYNKDKVSEEYKNIVNTFSKKLQEALKDSEGNNLELFNKTLVDIKETEYKK